MPFPGKGIGMSEGEAVILALSAALGIVGIVMTRTGSLHRVLRRGNPGVGLARVAIVASLAWVAFVIKYYADPSVTDPKYGWTYIVFYLVLGYAAAKLLGQVGARIFGMDLRVDVGERRNLAAAVFIAAFTLGTGLIFGGSLWGEADPEGGGEGGWWIPVGFFLLGWISMVATVAIYLAREPGGFGCAVRQERDVPAAWGAGAFTVGVAVVMTDAVRGDFFGWTDGLKDVGIAAGLLVLHEVVRAPAGAGRLRRGLETVVYLGFGVGAWVLTRVLRAL